MSRFSSVLLVPTLAAMRLERDRSDGDVAFLQGSSAKDDGLQGFYTFDADNTVTDTGDKIISVNDDVGNAITVGRWVRVGARACLPSFSQPATGSVAMDHSPGNDGHHTTTWILTAAEMSVTDAGGSGSYGTIDLGTLPTMARICQGCRQDYTAFAEDLLLTDNNGDAVFDIGIGSVAIASAADGALTGTNDDIGAEINLTMSSGTGAGTLIDALALTTDGTTTAPSFNLNWSGTATTIEANGKMYITGTITVSWIDVGDDL